MLQLEFWNGKKGGKCSSFIFFYLKYSSFCFIYLFIFLSLNIAYGNGLFTAQKSLLSTSSLLLFFWHTLPTDDKAPSLHLHSLLLSVFETTQPRGAHCLIPFLLPCKENKSWSLCLSSPLSPWNTKYSSELSSLTPYHSPFTVHKTSPNLSLPNHMKSSSLPFFFAPWWVSGTFQSRICPF